MAPEVLLSQNHSYPADFFAIGIMGYEFMIGERPYLGRSRKEIKDAVLQKQAKINFNDLPKGWSIHSADFINKLIKRKQERRLGFNKGIEELKKHQWFDGFDWESLNEKKAPSPFVPERRNNFDKGYCEAVELVNESTMGRYQLYVQKDDFISKFIGYTYYDESEISKMLQSNRTTNGEFIRNNSMKNIGELPNADKEKFVFRNFNNFNKKEENDLIHLQLKKNGSNETNEVKLALMRKKKTPNFLNIKSNYNMKKKNKNIRKLHISQSTVNIGEKKIDKNNNNIGIRINRRLSPSLSLSKLTINAQGLNENKNISKGKKKDHTIFNLKRLQGSNSTKELKIQLPSLYCPKGNGLNLGGKQGEFCTEKIKNIMHLPSNINTNFFESGYKGKGHNKNRNTPFTHSLIARSKK